ncbi:hypothetical protein SEA_DALILPOP_4 [Gordonia phage Dalilpop]|nr:hypothetical protein SEA_DALILPOP_4 [Gordonia phage Dalilpop]
MSQVRFETEYQKACQHGFSVRVGADVANSVFTGGPEIGVVTMTAPMTARGYLRFYLLLCGWICDECGSRVTVAKFHEHASGRKACGG